MPSSENGFKKCAKCKKTHIASLDYFYTNQKSPDKLMGYCRECAKAHAKEYNKKHAQWMYVKHKMTKSDYERILASQGGGCAICGSKPSSNRRLDIDHDHCSLGIRGLLCNQCNQAIGLLNEDIELLKAAIKYLTEDKLFLIP